MPIASMARHFAAFAVLVAAFCCLNYAVGQQNVVSVDVYYESLCPDSIYFITQELAPVYDDLKNFLRINLVPFGKASWTIGDGRQPAEFQCQHGPNECYGNRAQACALNEIQKSVVAEQQQRQSVKLVDCVMSSSNPARAVPSCAQKIGMGEASIGRINDCSGKSVLGDQLLIAAGEETKAFQSPISFVPSIAINGVRTPAAFRNFAHAVCVQIPRDQQPKLCRHV